ncbi:MAG: AEC family transporter [Candidatus Micrarchaeota archaeon]|nr:AEC family transporter [Candidatus Micrarchaeota archaeon]
MLEPILVLVAMIALGFIARHFSLLGEGAEKELSGFVYYVSMPCLILVKLATTSLSGQHLSLILLNGAAIAVSIIAVCALYYAGIVKGKFASALLLCSFFGNVVFMGFPAAQAYFGEPAIADAAVIAFAYNFIIFTVGLLLLGIMSGKGRHEFSFRKLLGNTVLYSCVIGALVSISGIALPSILSDTLSLVGATTVPLALFAMGAFLYGKKLGQKMAQVAALFLAKMAFFPLVMLCLAFLFGMRGYVLQLSFLEALMPVAVTNFVIAREFSLDAALVAEATVATTLASLPLLFLFGPISGFLA